MIKKFNMIKVLAIVCVMSTTFCGYAISSHLSSWDQTRIRTLVKCLNMDANNTPKNNTPKDVKVRALAKMDAEAIPALEKMGVEVTMVQDGLYSLYFDVSQLGEIRKVKGVKQVDLSREMSPLDQPSKKKGEPRQVVRPV